MKLLTFSRRHALYSLLQLVFAFFTIFTIVEPAALPAMQTLATSCGIKYNYIHIRASGVQPTFLLLHGFPSSVYDWTSQIIGLSAAGYGVLAPDLLGYGGTDKPTELEEYKFSKMSESVAEILEHECLTEVIGVGHDWGAGFLSKLVNFYPKLFGSLVFLGLPYGLPALFDLDEFNKQTEDAFGYPAFGYMYFFNETDAGSTIERHLNSFLHLAYPQTPELWRTDLCPINKLKTWLDSDKTSPFPSWETPLDHFYRLTLLTAGGLTGPTNWYKAAISNVDAEAIIVIPRENTILKQRVLFVGGEKDYVNRPELLEQAAANGKAEGWLEDVEVRILDGVGHWVMLERAREVTETLLSVGRNATCSGEEDCRF